MRVPERDVKKAWGLDKSPWRSVMFSLEERRCAEGEEVSRVTAKM